MFFIDIEERVWWAADQVWSRAWDYLSIKPVRHTIHIDEMTEVATFNHPSNQVPGKPFDRILLTDPTDTITILLSFVRREEVEDLLRLVQSRRPQAFGDPLVAEFMDGGFADWWRYR